MVASASPAACAVSEARRPLAGTGCSSSGPAIERPLIPFTAMPRSRCLCALLATAALGALPGTALAQSAGDDQYVDPFGDEAPQSQTQAPAATPAPAPAPAQPATPSAAATPSATPAGSAAAPAPVPAAAAGAQLPRTGPD